MRSNPSDITVCCVVAIRGATTHTGITGNESGCLKRENGPKVGGITAAIHIGIL